MMTSNMTPSCYVLLISAFCVASVMCANKTDEPGIKVSEKALMRSLLTYYNSQGIDGRPVKNPAHPVKVKMGVKLTKILNFDQENDKLTIAAWLVLNWVDEYLHYDAVTGIKRVFIPPSKVWTPDISLFNAQGPVEKLFETRMVVYPSGFVYWVPAYQMTSDCPGSGSSDAKEVTCTLKFGSWVYSPDLLLLDPSKEGFDSSAYSPHKDWELLKSSVNKVSKEYPCCPGVKYTSLHFSMTLRRRPKNDSKNKVKSAAHGIRSSWHTLGVVALIAIISQFRNMH